MATGLLIFAIFLVAAVLMFFRLLPAMLALPLMAAAIAGIEVAAGRLAFADLMRAVLADGSGRLVDAMVIAMPIRRDRPGIWHRHMPEQQHSLHIRWIRIVVVCDDCLHIRYGRFSPGSRTMAFSISPTIGNVAHPRRPCSRWLTC